nr:hypothetical protein [Desulfobacterales bacterium]
MARTIAPVDSILYSIVFSGPVYKEKDGEKGKFRVDSHGPREGTSKTELEASKAISFFKRHLPGVLQIAGNTTIGKGLVRTIFHNGNDEEAEDAE